MKNFYYMISFLCVLLIASCKEEGNQIVELEVTKRNITVTDVYPECGYRGDEFTIIGTDFGVSPELVKVYLGGQPLQVLSCQDTELRVKTSAESTAGTISVEILGTLVNSDVLYDVLGVPGVTKISRHFGFPGDEITFEGHDFGTEPAMVNLKFNGAAGIAKVVSCENEKFVVRVSDDAKTGDVSLSIASQDIFISFGEDGVFTVPQHAALNAVVPAAAAIGCKVTLEGENFTDGMEVFFGESLVQATEIQPSADGKALTCVVPEGLSEGANRITVSTKYETVSKKLDFNVKPFPVYTSISQDKAYVGKNIQINGENFGNRVEDVKVTFNGIEAEIISCEETKVEVKVPVLDEYPEGNVEVKMSLLGLEVNLGELSFKVLEAPIIDKITSTNVLNKNNKSAKIAYEDGDKVLIEGTGFSDYQDSDITIEINNTQIENSEITVSPTSIECGIPANLPSSVNIKIRFKDYDEEFTYQNIEFAKINTGTDVTEYILTNYEQPFVSVDEKTYNNWATPDGWNVNDAAKSRRNVADFPVGGMFLNPTSKNPYEIEGVLVLQTGWGCEKQMINGKIWQVAYLPQGDYTITLKVEECYNLDESGNNSIYFMISEGTKLPDYSSGISTDYCFIHSQTGEKTFTKTISNDGEHSIGLLANVTTENKNIKISSISIVKN